MRFRPCIDIHNGKVKQIVGGTLCDQGDLAAENFISEVNAAWYARKYREDGLRGGHVILLNPVSSPQYAGTREQALEALRAAPGTLQVGGGITPENADIFLKAGATHVIVTSYVFREGRIDYEALERMVAAVGREHLVLDMSARRAQADAAGIGADVGREGGLYVVTDRWQRFTREQMSVPLLETLAAYCSEFLVHGVDVEGKQAGPDEALLQILGRFAGTCRVPVTYAGGIRSLTDVRRVRQVGQGQVDLTIGSALDLFGGNLSYEQVLKETELCS